MSLKMLLKKKLLNQLNKLTVVVLKINNFIASVALACLLLPSYTLASNDDKLAQSIVLADEIKSTDYQKFSEILDLISKEKANLNKEQQEFYRYLSAYRLAYSGNTLDAIKILEDLATNASSKTVSFKSLGVIINLYVLSRNYTEVFSRFDQYEQMMRSMPDTDSKDLGLAMMALVFNQINQFDVGLYYAEVLLSNTINSRYKCAGMQFKLESMHRMGNYNQFDAIYDEAIETCINAKQPIYENIIRSYKIEYLLENDFQSALPLIDAAYKHVENTKYNVIVTLYKALYSAYYLKSGNYELAHKYGVSAIESLEEDDINYAVLLAYSNLYKTEKKQGNLGKALFYYEILVSKQKAFDSEKASGLLAYHLAKTDIELKNQRIALLNKDNELLFLQKNVIEQEVRQTRVLMAVLAVVLSIAVYLAYKGLTGRHRFKKIAEFDQLTGISNRYHFNTQAELALEFCQKNNQPAAVILFDLDHFKQINDNHGHAAGDWALQAVVGTCRHFMRNNDVFGRIGGEEFAVVLPGCQTDKAALLAEICRDAIAAIDTEESGTAFPLTASFGVSGSNTSGYQLKQLLADADKAMYRAKDGGRDQVVSFAEA